MANRSRLCLSVRTTWLYQFTGDVLHNLFEKHIIILGDPGLADCPLFFLTYLRKLDFLFGFIGPFLFFLFPLCSV